MLQGECYGIDDYMMLLQLNFCGHADHIHFCSAAHLLLGYGAQNALALRYCSLAVHTLLRQSIAGWSAWCGDGVF